MPKNETLDSDDFPLKSQDNSVVTQNGKEIAKARSPTTAEDIAERLNEDALRKHEDNWSA